MLVVFLAFLTEVVLLCRFDLRDQCAYLWGIPKEYSPIAAEINKALRSLALTWGNKEQGLGKKLLAPVEQMP